MSGQSNTTRATMLPESPLVGMFLSLWASTEANRGYSIDRSSLLANQQNPFDKLFGDVLGDVACTYFVIEFKTTRAGFKKEIVGAKAKALRLKLYDAYWADPHYGKTQPKDEPTWRLGRFCHFGAYGIKDGQLRFEAYGRAVHDEAYSPQSTKSSIQPSTASIGHTLHAQSYLREVDPRPPFDFSGPLDFGQFYAAITHRDAHRANRGGSRMGEDADVSFYPYYATRIGLPPEAFLEYLRRMLSFVGEEEIGSGDAAAAFDDNGDIQILLCAASVELGKAVFQETTIKKVLAQFEAMRRALLINRPAIEEVEGNEDLGKASSKRMRLGG